MAKKKMAEKRNKFTLSCRKQKKSKKRFICTNPETKETYLFEKTKRGIKTIEFLGYKTPSGKLIKR